MSGLRFADAARRTLGTRLRDLRLDAGLTAIEFSRRSGMHKSKVSKIENGVQNPSENDLKLWTAICGADDELGPLIAASREIDQMWVEYRRELRLGQKHIQSRAWDIYQQAELARVYEALHIPGILQTLAYATAQFTVHARLHALPVEDVEQAAETRVGVRRLLYSGSTRFSFLLEASALHNNIGGAAVMDEQLDLLRHVATLPSVALGILPLGRERSLYPGEGFYLFDDRQVRQEFWSGALRTSRPEEIAYFSRVFAALQCQAVYGDAAVEELKAARRRLHAT